MQALAQRLADNQAQAGDNKLLQAVQNKLMNWNNRTFFDHPFLNKDHSDYSGVDGFFKAVSHCIDLSQIYRIHDTCFYNESDKLLPCIVEVCQKEIREFNGGYQYLLQLWQRYPTSKKLSQLPLHNPTKKWAICENEELQYFLYTLQEGDEDSDCLHIVKKETEKEELKTVKIRGIGISSEVSSFLFHNNQFFEVRGQTLTVYSVSEEIFESSGSIHEGTDLEKQEFDIGTKVLDIILYQNNPLILMETKDNQIDFSFLFLGEEAREKTGKDDTQYILVQAALKGKRKEASTDSGEESSEATKSYSGNDPIVKFTHRLVLTDKEKKDDRDSLVSFAVALRESGGIDFYEKMSLLKSEESGDQRPIDLQSNFYNCFITKKCNKAKFEEDYSWVSSDYVSPIEGDSEHIITPTHVSFTQGYFGPSYLGFIHDSSTYEISKQVKQEVAKDVVQLFNGAVMKNEAQIACFTHNRYMSIYDLLTEEWSTHFEFESPVVKMFELKLESDCEEAEVCVQLENNKFLKLDFPIEEDRKKKWMPQITEILVVPEDIKILQAEVEAVNKYPLILLTYKAEGDQVQLDYLEMGTTELKTFKTFPLEGSCSTQDDFFVKSISNELEVFLILQKIDSEDREGSDIIVYQVLNKNAQLNWDTLHNLPEVEIYNKIHSIAGKNPNRRFILVDDINTYIITPAPFKLVTLEKTFIKSLFNYPSLDIHYAIVIDPQSTSQCDLKYFDIPATVQNQKSSLLPLYTYPNSANKQIVVGLKDSRFGFFQSYSQFLISIFPNRNYNQLAKKRGTNTYRFYKQIKDRVIINDITKNQLLTYDVVTAKLLHVLDSNIKDMDEFDRFNPRGLKSNFFVKSKPEETKWSIKDFYPAHMGETITLNQVNFRQAQCPTTLHKFRELEIKSENNIEILMEFSYPYDMNGSFNLNLVTSKDKTLLIARDHMGAFLYRIVPEEKPKVRLELVRQITQFSPELQVYYKYRMDMFTPNFSKFLVFDHIGEKNGRYLICNTFDGSLTEIPSDILELDNDDQEEDYSPQQMINKLQWIDENLLRIVNHKNGVEKIIDCSANYKETAFNQIPLFEELSMPEWKEEYHILVSRKEEKDPIKKLQKLYQEMKSLYFLFPNSSKSDYYELMMKQDYELFDHVTHSFTLMGWKIAEELKEENLKVKDLSDKTKMQLLYSIFPGGDTILHLLHESDEFYEFLEFCHPEAKSIKHHMPFLPNNEGKTPLHLLIEKKQTKAINTLLKHLSLYGADHHSKAIKDLFPELVELKLADFDNYLESRFIQSKDHLEIDKYKINFDSVGFTTSSAWISNQDFHDCFFDESRPERKVKVETLDIAGIYHYNDPTEDKFFDALANTDQFSYFELRSIQCLIDFNYSLVQKYLIRKLFMPFIVFHFFYLITIFAVFESRYEQGWDITFYIMIGINAIFATYFLSNEVRQIAGDGLNYFKSFWNYIDLIPVFGIYAIGVFSIIDSFVHASNPDERVSGTIQRIVVAIVTLFMWLKFLYFFRIFDKTSYLIRAVVEVVKTMRHFFLVLLFTIIAFGNAFLVLALGNESDEGKFITGYVDSLLFSYRMVLGDFDTGAFGDTAVPLVWVLFLIFTVFNIIVMLNLLIAVISDAYAAVAEQSEQAMYQERASMIAENNYLIPAEVRQTYAKEGQLLLVVTDLEDENRPTGSDAIIQKVDEVKTFLEGELTDIESLSTQDNQDVKSKLVEMKNFLLKTIPQERVQVLVNPNKLVKMTYMQLNIIYENDLTSWSCAAKKFSKCHASKATYPKTDEEEEFYYCSQCSFAMCVDCQDNYNDIHCHPMEKLKYSEVKQREPKFQEGWTCSSTSFKGCTRKDNAEANDFDILYHDHESEIEFCPQCILQHKVSA